MFRQPFIEGWDFVSILGEGSFGQVKLAMQTKNNTNLVAVKIIELKRVTNIRIIQKEICIHKSLSHERIVKFYGYRKEPEEFYVFMEYVPNGELYNMIEPGSPMNEIDCIRIFGQLLDGVEYMHNKGIVHRDIKLENLLIDANENLKITDFGLSTMFRHNGNERILNNVCGSVPYAAPEVLAGIDHKAEPIDIWSCGIILFIMFQGEMPWDSATDKSIEYSRWARKLYPSSRWGKLNQYQMDILSLILNISPISRADIQTIRKSDWYTSAVEKGLPKSTISSQNLNGYTNRFCISQQNVDESMITHDFEKAIMAPNAHRTDDAFFSQPIDTDCMIGTPGVSCNNGTLLSVFAKRLTRFIISDMDLPTIVSHLAKSLDFANCSWKLITQKCITVLMQDIRNQNLNFKIHIFCPPNGKTLIDFRLYRGDGLEFKRIFKIIKQQMSQLVPSLS